jgi:hypothetical protein
MKEEILEYLQGKMQIDDVSGDLMITKVKGKLFGPVKRTIQEIKEYFSHTDYTPLFSREREKHVVMFGIFKKSDHKPKYWLNIVLFVATLITTLFAGSFNSGGNPFSNFNDIWLGIPFSFSIMTILTCHELGHYFMSKKQGIVALPITLIGVAISTVQPAPEGEAFLRLGDSLLFSFLARVLHPDIPHGYDLFLHPMAFAGWIGFLITSMNLIPIGQLDGGHIAYSVFLGKRRLAYIPIFAGLVLLGIFSWLGWIFWGFLALFIARRDPMVQNTITPLTAQEKVTTIVPLMVLILTFIPQPFVFA